MIQKVVRLLFFIFILAGVSRQALAVVGYAERYDPFDEENLELFHDELVAGESESRQPDALDTFETVTFSSEEQEQAYNEQVKDMKEQLLNIPKRDPVWYRRPTYL